MLLVSSPLFTPPSMTLGGGEGEKEESFENAKERAVEW